MKKVIYILLFAVCATATVLATKTVIAQGNPVPPEPQKSVPADTVQSDTLQSDNMNVGEEMNVHFNAWTEIGTGKNMEKQNDYLLYARFRTEAEAQNAIPELQQFLKNMSSNADDQFNKTAWENECNEFKLHFRKSKKSGEFSFPALSGQAVLICTFNPDSILQTKDNVLFEVTKLISGQTDYNCVFKRKKIADNTTLQNVNIPGQFQTVKKKNTLPGVDGDSCMTIPVRVDIEPGWATEKSRLVIQPYIILAETGDTVDYVDGLVYEGVKYHALQDKRMRFDYMKNDKVAYAYVNKPLWSGEAVHIDTTLVYRKRDINAQYIVAQKILLSDYTHVYWRDSVPAPHNLTDFYKLIDYGQRNPLLSFEEKSKLITNFNIFKGKFAQYASGLLPADEAAKVKSAMDYLIAKNPDNMAVIYTEGRNLMRTKPSDIISIISQMDNDNPKKWYLLGIMAADKEQTLAGKRGKSYIPDYMCFFNHAFELQELQQPLLSPSYKWIYFKDGQISDDLRAKFKYSKHKIAEYREKFDKIAAPYMSKKKKVAVALVDGEGEIPLSGE